MSDGSASPEPGVDQDSTMTENKVDRASSDEKSPGESSTENNVDNKKPATKSNAKDPLRPRRKKARRACYACQRAHLTCGDERPCGRCIKRGLQDQCQDGVRKKAKYLHDAPSQALMPGFGNNYHHHLNGSHTMVAVPTASTMGPNGLPVTQSGNYYAQSSPPTNYAHYSPVAQHGSMGPPATDSTNMVGDYNAQTTVETPSRFQPNSSQQVSPVQDIASTLDPSSALGNPGNLALDGPFFDPNDPSLFNFNISDFNFGNHYGALEFGMLGQLSSGAVNTPDLDAMNSMNQSNHGSVSYDGTSGFASSLGYNQAFQPWQSIPSSGSRQTSSTNIWDMNATGMDAFAVRENTGSLTGASPHSQGQEFGTTEQASTLSPEMQFVQPGASQPTDALRQSLSQARPQARKSSTFPNNPSHSGLKKRPRDTSAIYSSVQEPYPYTQAFHNLIAALQKRLPSQKVLHVAKALASFRPSFISCNQSLTRADLIFMEQCFQRTLVQYLNFSGYYGTPTIVCRRTGEIAYANKEFEILSGWKIDVLLGNAPNLNVNIGNGSSGTQTGTSSKGTVTPRIPNNVDIDPSRPQPVFLLELMEDDDIVVFYQEFAELAFGASRESVRSRCSLLKYKTKEDPGWATEDRFTEKGKRLQNQPQIKAEASMKSQASLYALGERDGRVDCAYCWSLRRDVFDIPMLIVMNFLPNLTT